MESIAEKTVPAATGNGIWIRHYQPVQPDTLRLTMACLEALSSKVNEQEVDTAMGNALGADAILALRYHCSNPLIKIDSVLFKPIAQTLLNERLLGNREEMGSFLFGPKWQDQIQNDEPLVIANPDIRATITAANPIVKVRYYNPVNVDHQPSMKRFQEMRQEDTGRLYDQNVVQPEAGDTLAPQPSGLGAEWCLQALKTPPFRKRHALSL